MRDIAFKTFLTCMFTTAALVLAMIWGGSYVQDSEVLERLIPTFFILGVASALYWLAIHLRDIVHVVLAWHRRQ